ncbi:MAG: RNA pseudouridine synthase [Pseudolabrys sp.]|nr:RNA pseudouridine synthase [Pseudolabrys sp.]
MTPDEMLARLLYRDGMMLVVDKPAGLSVHRGPKGGHSLEDYFGALRFGLPRDPALAHRLDKDTSGCLVLGRHRKALALLGKLFKQGKVGKTYWAVVEGGPAEDEGLIDMALSEIDKGRGWWMKPDPHGKPASSTWKVMGRYSPPPCGEGLGVGVELKRDHTNAITPLPNPPPRGGREQAAASSDVARATNKVLTWLALEPLTGRTHQLRVHCAEMGFPIVGDPIYGNGERTGGTPLHLHSRAITVPISKNKPAVTVEAPVPEHMRELLTLCGWSGETITASTHSREGGNPEGREAKTE